MQGSEYSMTTEMESKLAQKKTNTEQLKRQCEFIARVRSSIQCLSELQNMQFMHHKLASCLLVEHAFNHALNFRGDVCFDVCFTLKYPSRGYKGIFSYASSSTLHPRQSVSHSFELA